MRCCHLAFAYFVAGFMLFSVPAYGIEKEIHLSVTNLTPNLVKGTNMSVTIESEEQPWGTRTRVKYGELNFEDSLDWTVEEFKSTTKHKCVAEWTEIHIGRAHGGNEVREKRSIRREFKAFDGSWDHEHKVYVKNPKTGKLRYDWGIEGKILKQRDPSLNAFVVSDYFET